MAEYLTFALRFCIFVMCLRKGIIIDLGALSLLLSTSFFDIIFHCSATRCDRCYTERDLTTDHLRRGFSDAGYPYYIRKNGDIKSLRPIEKPGAHTRGYNANSIGICYEGGLDENGRPADTRTPFLKHSLRVLVMLLIGDYPGSRLCGHRDLSPDLNHNGEIEPQEWIKQCPCFDAASILVEADPDNPAYL